MPFFGIFFISVFAVKIFIQKHIHTSFTSNCVYPNSLFKCLISTIHHCDNTILTATKSGCAIKDVSVCPGFALCNPLVKSVAFPAKKLDNRIFGMITKFVRELVQFQWETSLVIDDFSILELSVYEIDIANTIVRFNFISVLVLKPKFFIQFFKIDFHSLPPT